MNLPSSTNHFSHCVQFGEYVISQLRLNGKTQLVDDVQTATVQLQNAGRKMEGARSPKKVAIANRESAEVALAVSVRGFRLKLSARRLDAASTPPYTHIFFKGISYYTSNPLEMIESRYRELLARIESELSEDDSLRQEAIQTITTGLERFNTTVDEVATTRATVSIARTHYKTARKMWDTQMTKVYAALMSELGKHEAKRFFPKNRKQREPAMDNNNATETPPTITQLAS